MGAAMGWVAFVASPTYRRRFLANSALAGFAFGDVRAAVAHAGRMVAELPRLWMGATMPCALTGEAKKASQPMTAPTACSNPKGSKERIRKTTGIRMGGSPS